ncbi:putative endonuclease [Marinobacter sp. LV10R510-11A]|uniref:YraN family protein n=1 Tax=Marinobacter sp. LV10R510-11A TaxID=1415568 RepID=UPI000BB98A68|nr:YraN family protein [Marinobacter sp. LV10R510-11A]SOB76588.1 putative endonuclease [Marinobacter sp. LV10R510-11A]
MEGRKAIGTHFEGVAARYLAIQGVRILERNVYNRGGEIDLIGQDKNTLVFFEVRYRGSGSLVDPAGSISYPKRQRLLKAASFYLHRHHLWDTLCRIDVVAISPGTIKKYRVQWIKNAIQADV